MAVQIYLPEKIYVAPSSIHGYGVFAKSRIGAGEIIEECTILDLDLYRNDSCWHVLEHYRFFFPNQNPTKQVITTGYGALYNHSNKPNVMWKSSISRETFFFYAIRDIEEGEELVTYYGGDDYWGQGNRMKPEELK
jgi:SET domain-containing protein